METVVTINVVGLVLYIVVVYLAFRLGDAAHALYKRYIEWLIKKLK